MVNQEADAGPVADGLAGNLPERLHRERAERLVLQIPHPSSLMSGSHDSGEHTERPASVARMPGLGFKQGAEWLDRQAVLGHSQQGR
jgi:hypothetical protein